MDLPPEIVNNIIEILDRMAKFESDELEPRKRQGIVVISDSGDKQPYKTYLHRNSPILNTIQSFAMTSREIYQLCRPWLWQVSHLQLTLKTSSRPTTDYSVQKLQFPTRLPAPIDLWTKDILLKQGSLVRSLSLDLSKNCSRPEGSVDRDPFYDNLNINMDYIDEERVSPKNAKDLITRCPNLSKLEISYTLRGDTEDGVQLSAFLLDLVPLISSLKHLRHMSLLNYMGEENAVKLPSELIVGLPLLESLRLTGLTVLLDQGTLGEDSFGYNLSKLRHLSELDLCGIGGISEKWCLYNWAETITHLEIYRCGNLSPISAHRIVHHIAPRLKSLTLSFDQDDGSWAIDPSLNSRLCFSLPYLNHLLLCTRNPNLLGSFQDCKSLHYLEWTYVRLEHCRTLSGFLFRPTWPQLKKLAVYENISLNEEARDPRDQEIEDELVSLEKYCEQANIKAKIHRRWL
ncbi:uncharacterized protein MELLADRAFT_64932 [Melampsora larici-populina 98AG31]|uniref:F-box domain-containing protein n=1 Tax=Melampsora larici-populina (strain 98AG31 / pathotype 3-4-7) TaxID=747676 RepID=F4RTB8_MELLP|nr:uncharacterized protein MELLADRAFT_64932 [Melampsora larici-populina 98AG31]EGG04373.1 hypothetical protein MELLADRAFT_64932 [Melampsora larici-populina 98AG31]